VYLCFICKNNRYKIYRKVAKTQVFCHPPREGVGGKPAKTEADVPLLQKSDRRKLLLQLCGNTASGCGLGAGDRRRSRHAQIIIKNIIPILFPTFKNYKNIFVVL